jgi:hypothetical protein
MLVLRTSGRIRHFDPVAGKPVHKAWDIGVRDDTSIWWFQVVGGVPHIIDCYTNHGAGVDHYAEVCRERDYQPGIDFVPHDAKVFEWGGKRTRLEAMFAEGLQPQLVPDASKLDGINAARITLKTAVFHPRTEEIGISALEQYRREWDDDRKTFGANEVRDWTTHLSDAFRYLALAWRDVPIVIPEPVRVPKPGQFIPPPVREITGKRIRV